MTTQEEVAEWMVSQLEEGTQLRQQDAAREIKELFGEEFVYLDSNDDLAISRKVLYRFKKLTGDAVV